MASAPQLRSAEQPNWFWQAVRDFLARYYSLVIIAVMWELAPRLGLIKVVLLPPLSHVCMAVYEMVAEGHFLVHLGQTLFRMGAGIGLAVIVGVPVGVLMASRPNFRAIVSPLISFAFPVPKVGIYPAMLLMFGFFHTSKIALVFIEAVFPMILSSLAGAAQVNPKLLWSATAMGTPPGRLLWRVIMPSALPQILSGLRVAIVVSIISVFVAEMISSGEGLGHLMVFNARKFESARMFAAIVTISVLGLLFDSLLLRFRRWILRWHVEAELH